MNVLRKLRGGVAMARIVKDANRLDQVFELLDNLSDEENLDQIVRRFTQSEEGRASLRERPRLQLDLECLARFPADTLAHAYATHMRAHNLDPNAIPNLPSQTPTEWVAAHLYETHDLWHVLTGFGTDVAGELGLQAFYAAQVGSPLPFALLGAGMLNTALYSKEDGERRMDAVIAGWTCGRQTQSLLGVRWDLLWATPLREVRQMLGITCEGATAREPPSTRGSYDPIPSQPSTGHV